MTNHYHGTDGFTRVVFNTVLPSFVEIRTARPNVRKKKQHCTELLSHIILTRSQCRTAAAEGAKLSAISRHLKKIGKGVMKKGKEEENSMGANENTTAIKM